MQQNESEERLREGLKKAASCARKLGKLQKSKTWLDVAKQIDGLVQKANGLMSSGVLSEADALVMLDKMIAMNVLSNGSNKVN